MLLSALHIIKIIILFALNQSVRKKYSKVKTGICEGAVRLTMPLKYRSLTIETTGL